MSTITKPIILIYFFVSISWSLANAQYKALEISTCSSSFIDDNKDAAYEFRLGEPTQLRQFSLGFSVPLSPHVLITPKIGFACAQEQYFNENNFTFIVNREIAHKTSKELFYGNVGIESTYWFQPDYNWFFLSVELNTAFNLSATSVSRITTYEDTFNYHLTQNVAADFSTEINKIMPTVKVGLGYNLDLLTQLNFFAKINIEYRPAGYYKDTEYVSYLSRHYAFGIKYVFGGKTSVVKRFLNDYNENNNQ